MKKIYLALLPMAAMVLVGCRGGRGGRGSTSAAPSGTSAAPSGQTTNPGPGPSPTTGGGTTTGAPQPVSSSVTPVGPRETDDGWVEQITAPTAAGGEYIFGTYDETNSKFAFLDGGMVATYYQSCQATTSNAVKFTLESSGTGFKIKATSGSVSGKYLAITCTDGSHVNGSYASTGSVFDWVESEEGVTGKALGVLIDKDGEGGYDPEYYLLAMQPTKSTLAPAWHNFWGTNYIGRLYVKK